MISTTDDSLKVEEFQQKFKNLSDIKNSLLKEFKAYITDKQYPIEQRYKLFLKFQSYLPTTDGYDFFGLDLDFIYYPERYQEINFDHLIENLEAILIVEKDFDFSAVPEEFKNLTKELCLVYTENSTVTDWNNTAKTEINKYIEQVLASGYSAFVFNW